MEILGQEVYRQALEEEQIEPFAPGMLEQVIERDPLTLRYTIPLTPEVELGSYKDIRIEYESPEISDEQVNDTMEELRQRQALIEPADRPAQLTDVVVLDLVGELLESEEGEEAELVREAEISVLVNEETDWPFPGVIEHLVGVNAGDEFEAEHTFAEDYPSESLRGKQAKFQFKIQEVKSRLVPEWTDALAQGLGEYEDLLDLRIKVRETLTEEATRQAEAEFAEEVMLKVVEGAAIAFPEILLKQEQHDMLQELNQRLHSQKLTLEDYLKIEGKTEQDLLDEVEPRARDRLSRALVLGKIVEVEGLETSEQDITDRIDQMLEPLEDGGEKLRAAFDNPEGRRRIRLEILTDRAIQRLTQRARGEEVLEQDDSFPEPSQGDSDVENNHNDPAGEEQATSENNSEKTKE
jgi:trigger factor